MSDSAGADSARSHLRTAAEGVQQVRRLLTVPCVENAEKSAAILQDVEVQLGCAAALLQSNGIHADSSVRSALEHIQREVAVLARFLSEADKMLGVWLRAVQTKRAGYTKRGQAAPLVLVSKMSVEG